jgi:hypothetical protein
MAAWILHFDQVSFTGGNTVENVGECRIRKRMLLSQTTHHLRERCWLTHLHSGVILRFMRLMTLHAEKSSMRATCMLNPHKIIGLRTS